MPLIAHDVHSTRSMYTRQTRGSLVVNVYILYGYIFHFTNENIEENNIISNRCYLGYSQNNKLTSFESKISEK